jgi:hypothetical protein
LGPVVINELIRELKRESHENYDERKPQELITNYWARNEYIFSPFQNERHENDSTCLDAFSVADNK